MDRTLVLVHVMNLTVSIKIVMISLTGLGMTRSPMELVVSTEEVLW